MYKIKHWMVIVIIYLVSGCATIHETDSTKLYVIQASAIISEPKKYQLIIKKYINEGKELVVFFKKGQSVPLRINMLFPIAKLETKPNNLIFSHDTFLLISRSKLRISPDGQRWSDIYDVDSQKKLFKFDKGSVSVGFQATKEEGPVFTLGVTTE